MIWFHLRPIFSRDRREVWKICVSYLNKKFEVKEVVYERYAKCS